MQNVRLDEAQAGIKIVKRNINNIIYADDTILMAESEELKNLLMKVKKESEKIDFKLNIQWQKPLQYCKVISLQLIKINGKKTQHSEN